MDQTAIRIRGIVDEVVGHRASPIFMNRVSEALGDCTGDRESLCQACAKVKKLVYLFISIDDAERLAERFKQAIEETA